MKLCVFSDIHANKYAFEKALPLLKKEGADQYLFLGDLVGYYFNIIEVWQMLKELPNLICIAGNHDLALTKHYRNQHVPKSYSQKYGSSTELFLKSTKNNRQELVKWIERLPPYYSCERFEYIAAHAHPNKNFEYIYPDSALPENDISKCFFLGHTHYPMFRKGEHSVYINPGSIGQPRKGVSSFLTIDLKSNEYKFHYFNYDTKALLNELDQFKNTPSYLKDVILRSLSL